MKRSFFSSAVITVIGAFACSCAGLDSSTDPDRSSESTGTLSLTTSQFVVTSDGSADAIHTTVANGSDGSPVATLDWSAATGEATYASARGWSFTTGEIADSPTLDSQNALAAALTGDGADPARSETEEHGRRTFDHRAAGCSVFEYANADNSTFESCSSAGCKCYGVCDKVQLLSYVGCD